MQIGKNTVVTINYTLTNPEGEVLDSNAGKDPLHYIHGSGAVIPGLEAALEGKSAGENIKTVISPEQGYGAKDPRLVQKVAKSSFQGVAKLEAGMKFQAAGQDGHVHFVRVVEIIGDQVTIDANHELAGVTLSFDVTVVNVRAATADELAHGHVHGPGGHHHH